MPSKNPKQPDDKSTPARGDELKPTEPRQPRFDDRPEPNTSRSNEGKGENPSLPRYGDTERDDPRRSHTEAGSPGDVDGEVPEEA